MCLTIPRKITKVSKGQAWVLGAGKDYRVKIDLVKGIKKGDWVLVQADLVVQKLKKKEAKEIIEILETKKP